MQVTTERDRSMGRVSVSRHWVRGHSRQAHPEPGKYRVFTEDLEWSCVATAQHVRRQGRQPTWKGLLGSELRGLERHGANLTGKGK